MKKHTKKDLRIGTVWKRREGKPLSLRIDEIRGDIVMCTVVEHYYSNLMISSQCSRSVDVILGVYEPVYTIEGFEV